MEWISSFFLTGYAQRSRATGQPVLYFLNIFLFAEVLKFPHRIAIFNSFCLIYSPTFGIISSHNSEKPFWRQQIIGFIIGVSLPVYIEFTGNTTVNSCIIFIYA
jgi:hypothetical protein